MKVVRFSILIANYNNGKFLRKCLESVKSQTSSDWEVIFVDDCSTDGSVGIFRSVANGDKRFFLFVNEKNMGCAFTKARCVKESRGEICGFLDSDDALLPDAVSVMSRYHAEHPDCSLISSRFYFCRENLRPFMLSPAYKTGRFVSYLVNPSLSHFNTFKKIFYEMTDGISSDYKLGVDQDLCVKLEEVGKIAFVKETLYLYRVVKGSISHRPKNTSFFYNFALRIDSCRRRKMDFDILSPLLDQPRIFRRILNGIRRRIAKPIERILFTLGLIELLDEYHFGNKIQIFDNRVDACRRIKEPAVECGSV